MELARLLASGKNNEEWSRDNNGESGELNGADGFAEEEPSQDEVKNGGELDEKAEISGVVEFEGAIIKNTGDRINHSRHNKGNEKRRSEGGKVESSNGKEENRDNGNRIAIEKLLGDCLMALEINVGNVVVNKNA